MTTPTPTDRSEGEKIEALIDKAEEATGKGMWSALDNRNMDRPTLFNGISDLLAAARIESFNLGVSAGMGAKKQDIAAARREAFNKAIELFGTHDEGFGSYCDTGDDMEWSCRSECTAHGINRVRKYMADFLAEGRGKV